jgi:hypothetical protein
MTIFRGEELESKMEVSNKVAETSRCWLVDSNLSLGRTRVDVKK